MPQTSLRARRLSANLSFLFTEWPFLDRFAAAKDAGFTAVEFLFPYDYQSAAIAREIERLGLELVLFNAPCGDWEAGERGLAALAERVPEFRRSIETAISYAQDLNVGQIHVMAGNADTHDPAAKETYTANLAWAAERMRQQGLVLLIEPINQYDMPGYFLQDFDRAAQIVTASEDLALQFDIYHCHRLGVPVLPALERLLPLIRHIQIAGVPDRSEPAAPDLPLRAIFELLDRTGYNGRVGCEYRPAAGTLAGLGWIDRLEESMQ